MNGLHLPINGLNQCKDLSIIDALQNGNAKEQLAAFKCIIKKCYPGSKAILKNRGLSKEKIDDVLQEALLDLWKNVKSGKYTNTGPLCAYFGKIAYNIAMNKLKAKKLIYDEFPKEIEDPNYELSPIKELYNYCLNHCIEILKAQNKNHYLILRYYYWENLRIREIAAKTGYTEGAIRVILHTIRIRLGICIIGCRAKKGL